MKKYDLIVVGAGSGGLVAAETAADLGASVALVEKQNKLGGECLHYGCVPSKSLIHVARQVYTARTSPYVEVNKKPVDFKQVTAHLTHAINCIEKSHDNDEYFTAKGVTVLHGDVRFTGKRTLQAGTATLTAKRIIIATGSSPFVPPIEGIDDVPYLTNETIFSLKELPKSLIVVGGGPIGCELGQAFAMLGSKVSIVQSGPRLLPKEEEEASELLHKSMKKMDIELLYEAKLKAVSAKKNGVTAHIDKDGKTNTIEGSHILIATGRKPNVPDNLEVASVRVGKRGIGVNENLQTHNSNIYAIGDCNGGLQFTHTAAEQAALTVRHALYGFAREFMGIHETPWVTFTLPEIAHFGETKTSLSEAKKSYSVRKIDYTAVDKAITENESGYVEVLIDKGGAILGATIVGRSAGELINSIAIIKKFGTLKDAAGIIQAYPTYGMALKQLASNLAIEDATSGIKGIIVRHLRKFNLR